VNNLKGLEEFSNALKRYKGKDFKYGLSDKKSERTTFNLGKEATESLGWLISHAEVKVKEVIDHAIEHWMGILTGEKDEWKGDQAIFQKMTIAKEGPKTRKTYVVSFGAVRLLNNLSSNFKIPRDKIMETIIIDYALFVKKSNEKRIQKYQLAYDKVIALGDMAESVYAEVEALLGENDPITEMVFFGMSHIVDDAIPMLEKAIDEKKPLKLTTRPQVKFVTIPKEIEDLLKSSD